MIGDYLIRKELGKEYGNNSSCFVGKKEGKKYCLKIIELKREEKKKQVEREIKILSKLKSHRNIVQLTEYFDLDENKICLVTEKMEMNLAEYIERMGERLSEDLSRKISYQILSALNFCHQNKVIHNDLKAENVLIDSNKLDIQLIDFGFANLCDSIEEMSCLVEFQGTLLYISPEKYSFEKYDGIKSDLWSFGVLVYRMVFGEFPFGNFAKTMKDINNL